MTRPSPEVQFRACDASNKNTEYLTRPYFDQWYSCYATMLLGSGLVTAEELATGRSTQSGTASLKPMSASDVPRARNTSARFDQPYAGQPRFGVGDRVRSAMAGSPGHTRLPRYVRGHVGTVRSVNGAHVFPDESAQGHPVAEPLYNVTFRLDV